MKTITLFSFFLCLSLFAHEGHEVEVLKVKGEVQASGKKVVVGQKFHTGAVIEVIGKKSFVHLRFDDGSMLLQKEGRIKLKKVESKETLISLLKGIIHVYKNPKADSKLNVKTKQASMAVRGTKFYVEETDQTYLCVCEGVVAARNKHGTVDVMAGEDLFAPNRQSLKKKKAKEMMIDIASEGFDIMGIPVK